MNMWSHLAATYDGTVMRLYVNGVQAGRREVTGSMRTSGGPLTFGGDALFGQYFAGRIDEVRLYGRALSAAEIQDDMATPVVGVESPNPSPAIRSGLLSAAPNPFGPTTHIRFRLASSQGARLRVFDVTGRLVRVFDLQRLIPGEHVLTWDGGDDDGRPLATGVYVARLDSVDAADAMRIVLVR
jgi:hypothetical protein